jgi:hypothetical protein
MGFFNFRMAGAFLWHLGQVNRPTLNPRLNRKSRATFPTTNMPQTAAMNSKRRMASDKLTIRLRNGQQHKMELTELL